MKQKEIVVFDGVHASYGRHKILQHLSFKVHLGEFLYLVGPTGVGKSTILKLIYGDCPLHAGKLKVDQFQLDKIKRKEIPFLRRKLGIVFQDFQLLPDRDIFANIEFALRASGWKGKARIKQRITEVLINVGMAGKAHAYPHQLSGGQQQRVAIARALINHPVVLIADEPTGNLDPNAAVQVMEMLKKINSGGTAVIMATHEYPIIKQFPNRVIEVLPTGGIMEYEKARDFLSQLSY